MSITLQLALLWQLLGIPLPDSDQTAVCASLRAPVTAVRNALYNIGTDTAVEDGWYLVERYNSVCKERKGA